jgi:hypothetical protein
MQSAVHEPQPQGAVKLLGRQWSRCFRDGGGHLRLLSQSTSAGRGGKSDIAEIPQRFR